MRKCILNILKCASAHFRNISALIPINLCLFYPFIEQLLYISLYHKIFKIMVALAGLAQ